MALDEFEAGLAHTDLRSLSLVTTASDRLWCLPHRRQYSAHLAETFGAGLPFSEQTWFRAAAYLLVTAYPGGPTHNYPVS